MKIGMTDSAYERLYGRRKYEKMKEHGWDCCDWQGFVDTETPLFSLSGADFERTLLAEKKLADDAGIEISQVHGPWRHPPKDGTPEDRAERLAVMKKTIRGASLLGSKNWIIHNIMPFGTNKNPDEAEFLRLNREFMEGLLEEARAHDVTIQLENMPFTALTLSTPEQVTGFVRSFDDSRLKICLDTGHAAVFHIQPSDAVRTIGGLLGTLHVHDNDGQHDRHDFPFTGWVDWNAFAAALKEAKFGGVLSIESSVKAAVPADAAELMLLALAKTAKHLAADAE